MSISVTGAVRVGYSSSSLVVGLQSARVAREGCAEWREELPARPPTANATGFDEHFGQARTNIFRLETLQNYGNSGEDIGIVPVAVGQHWPPELLERTDFWLFDLSVLFGVS